MAPLENLQLIRIFTVKSNNAVMPAGVISLSAESSFLSDVRTACSGPNRNLMETADLFLLPSPNSLSSFCPITQADEQRISVNQYFCAAQQATSIYCGSIDRPPTYTDSKESVTCSNELGLVLNIPYVLTCWGTSTPKQSDNRPAVTSYLTARLPDAVLSENASFSVFARTPEDGQRVILSIECPFHDGSVLEIGTQAKTREVYARSIACEDTLYAGSSIDTKGWTHVAVVWSATAQTLLLYVNGTLARVTALDKAEKVAFVQSIKAWRLALGRGKSEGKTRHGWEGEIADVCVWERALEEAEVAKLAERTPHPMNPNAKFNTREC